MNHVYSSGFVFSLIFSWYNPPAWPRVDKAFYQGSLDQRTLALLPRHPAILISERKNTGIFSYSYRYFGGSFRRFLFRGFFFAGVIWRGNLNENSGRMIIPKNLIFSTRPRRPKSEKIRQRLSVASVRDVFSQKSRSCRNVSISWVGRMIGRGRESKTIKNYKKT